MSTSKNRNNAAMTERPPGEGDGANPSPVSVGNHNYADFDLPPKMANSAAPIETKTAPKNVVAIMFEVLRSTSARRGRLRPKRNPLRFRRSMPPSSCNRLDVTRHSMPGAGLLPPLAGYLPYLTVWFYNGLQLIDTKLVFHPRTVPKRDRSHGHDRTHSRFA